MLSAEQNDSQSEEIYVINESDEDNKFGGALIFYFRKWWCHVQPKDLWPTLK